MWIRVYITLLFLCNVEAHNWMHSPSRSQGTGTLQQPAPPRPVKRTPHYQVARNQEFAIEWSTGHPGTYYYFILLRAVDEKYFSEHSFGNHEKRLNDYLDNAPDSAKLWVNNVQYEKIHVAFGYYNDRPTTDAQYHSKLNPGNTRYFQRPESWTSFEGTNFPGQQQFRYNDDQMTTDAHAQYYNPKYPHVIAAHRYSVHAEDGIAHEWDLARMSVDVEPGAYVLHMLWSGYRDVIDLDVLPIAQVADVYGTRLNTEWMKIEHCQWPNFQTKTIRTGFCNLIDGDNPSDVNGCLINTAGVGMNGAHVVPVFNPTCQIYTSRDECEYHLCEWKIGQNRCGPFLQKKIKENWREIWARGVFGSFDDRDAAEQALQNKDEIIIRRRCPIGNGMCDKLHGELYYKWIGNKQDFDMRSIIGRAYDPNSNDPAWITGPGNRINQQFEIYSTLNDLLKGRQRWNFCPDKTHESGFPGNCGKWGESSEQYFYFSFEFMYLDSHEERPIKEIYSERKVGRMSCRSSYIDNYFLKKYDYYCGRQSEDGCWCDAECEDRGDCCDDNQDYCDSVPIGEQCNPNAPDCNSNAYCGENQNGVHYCYEKCTEQNGNEHLARTDNAYHCWDRATSHLWDQKNEHRHFRYIGCYTTLGGPDLDGWEGPQVLLQENPRRCYVQCKARGFRYFAIMGHQTCRCGDSYGNEIPNRPGEFFVETPEDCYGCGNEPGDWCGGSPRNSIYEITECPNELFLYSEPFVQGQRYPRQFVSPHLCWESENASDDGNECGQFCIPPTFMHEPDVAAYLSRCPNSLCEYYRAENGIGEYVNGIFADGQLCDRGMLREYVEEGKENVLACFGFTTNDPVGYFNPEAETKHLIIADDPEDPVFYSSCYKQETARSFANGFDSEPIAIEIPYYVGERCLSCDAIDKMKTTAAIDLTPTWWNTTGLCQKQCE